MVVKGAYFFKEQNEAVIRRYEDRHRVQKFLFAALDWVLSRNSGIVTRNEITIPQPRRLLLSNAGHLGDVIITTALLPVLHHYFPGIEIGILIGSHSQSVVKGHPLITRVHVLDHWYLRRDVVSMSEKLTQYYVFDRGKAIRELSTCAYDVAIDVRAWFPNFISVLSRVKIPISIGFNRMGLGRLLTHPCEHRYDRRHELEYQFELLKFIGVERSSLWLAQPSLPPILPAAISEAKAVVGNLERYHVLHMAASTSTRDWPFERWKMLALSLVDRGITPVLTGYGPRDAAMNARIAYAVPGCVDACDRLSWNGLVAMIAGAELVYSVETSVGHVAAALKRPVVAIYGGMADPRHWKPYGDNSIVATKLMNCNPCFNKKGCNRRECLVQLETEEVISIATQLIHNFREVTKSLM
jgi:ADP-heptose:LPS heptosyltransferase